MADTVRTRAQLLTLLADNQTGDIGPQDMRDMLVSLMGVYGAINIINNGVAQAVAAGVAEKVENFDENGLSIGMTPDYVNNEITADNTGVYQVFAKLSVKASTSNVNVESHIRVDDVENPVGFHIKIASSGFQATGAMMALISLNAGEKLSVWFEADKSCDLTVEHCELVSVRIG